MWNELLSLIIRNHTEAQFVKGIQTVHGKEKAICHALQQGG